MRGALPGLGAGGEIGQEEEALAAVLRRHLIGLEDEVVQSCVDQLLARHGSEVAAILFYGSCLFEETRTRSSFPDFYLLSNDLLRYHRSLLHTLLNLILPPNVYYASFENGLRCKYCVLGTAQYQAETSARAADVHHLGRFSKRFALVYARDSRIEELVVQGALQAVLTLVPHALGLLPEAFSLEELIVTQLSLSYLGEQRVAEPDKVEKLFEAARDYYLEVYGRALQVHAARHGTPRLASSGRYLQQPLPGQRTATDRFLRRSRMRGVLRWPKYMLTVDDWLQYILDKLERHQGIHLQLSQRERLHPILYGWPIFLEMRRRGVVG